MQRPNLACLVRRAVRWAACGGLALALSASAVSQKPSRGPSNPKATPTAADPTEPLPDTPDSRRWSAWAAEHGARVQSIGGGRVLFVHPTARTSLSEVRTVIASTIARFDEVLGISETPLPPVVLLDLADAQAFGAAMDELAEQNPYASEWLRSIAAKPSDFVLEDPVVGALAFFTGEREEWDPMNEVAHRTSHLLLVQRFGHQPNWLRVGLSWTLEQDVRGSIYCFPGRSDFVSVAEHDGWSSELTSLYKPKGTPPITIDELCRLTRGRFQADAAARAWGAARYFVEHERAALPKILAELCAAWEEQSRETHADGSWVRKPNFELDAASQAAIFERHAGPEVWKRLTEAFRDARRLTPASVKPAQKARKR
ncbi:MAG: hypothetical protein IT453_20385 [Planctomycetes bacterium]|nr:hypothetical protein [Planctomycetota bacterium]